MSAPPLLRVSDLRSTANGVPILNGVSFDVARGERVALVGSNGAGKTTTLRLIDRLIDRESGEILLNGVDVRKIKRRELAKTIAFVRQISGSFFSFSARQVVETARFPYLSTFAPFSADDRSAVDEAMERTGVSAFANRTLDSLSGGERQKTLIAAAFAQEPELLLLDEPTTYLDYRSQDEISATIFHWTREKRATVLEATHDLNRAALFSDRVVALRAGEVVFDGPGRFATAPETLRATFGVVFPTVRHPSADVPIICPDVAQDV